MTQTQKVTLTKALKRKTWEHNGRKYELTAGWRPDLFKTLGYTLTVVVGGSVRGASYLFRDKLFAVEKPEGVFEMPPDRSLGKVLQEHGYPV